MLLYISDALEDYSELVAMGYDQIVRRHAERYQSFNFSVVLQEGDVFHAKIWDQNQQPPPSYKCFITVFLRAL